MCSWIVRRASLRAISRSCNLCWAGLRELPELWVRQERQVLLVPQVRWVRREPQVRRVRWELQEATGACRSGLARWELQEPWVPYGSDRGSGSGRKHGRCGDDPTGGSRRSGSRRCDGSGGSGWRGGSDGSGWPDWPGGQQRCNRCCRPDWAGGRNRHSRPSNGL